MSGPYDYQQYSNQQGSQYPAGGYAPQNSGYPPQQGYEQGYGQQQQPQQHHQQQEYSSYPSQGFSGQQTDSFGPPQQGGYQHGQAEGQYGAYDASNPQGHSGYHGSQSGQGHHDSFSQSQGYGSQSQGGHQGSFDQQQQQNYPDVSQHEFAKQSSDPQAPNYDANAPPMTESDRGLLGAIGGGLGGHYLGKKADHGFLGTIGGAILGSLTEDYAKKQTKQHHSGGSHHGGSQSSWGGKW